jgi:ASC-1-like (ASCH) protein
MMHFMNLHPAPFASIKAGVKDVEMRLYDDKRRLIKPGDLITFTNTETAEKIVCAVLTIKVFENFESLYANYDKQKLGYLEKEIASPEDMKQYYPLAEMQANGVCAIEIELIGALA